MKIKSKFRMLLKIFITCLIISVIGISSAFGVSAYVKSDSEDKIITSSEATVLDDVDCIIILGCYVDDTEPSPMLEDRLKVGIDLYKSGTAPKILMSGDHGSENYDEVYAMKQYAIDCGVPSEDIFMDHAGFSTYESIYRASEIFGAEKVVIVTQKYHLYRSIYIAEQLGIEAYGVPSDLQYYVRQNAYDLREVLARDKDFFQTILKTEPEYLGEFISITGNGNITNDEKEFVINT